jgi:hypothetical protein
LNKERIAWARFLVEDARKLREKGRGPIRKERISVHRNLRSREERRDGKNISHWFFENRK